MKVIGHVSPEQVRTLKVLRMDLRCTQNVGLPISSRLKMMEVSVHLLRPKDAI